MLSQRHAEQRGNVVTAEAIRHNANFDHMGLNIPNREQSIFGLFSTMRHYFAVLKKELTLPNPAEPDPSPPLSFNRFYIVKDIRMNHFQLHSAFKALSENCFLYTSEEAVKTFDGFNKRQSVVERLHACDSVTIDESGEMAAVSFEMKHWGLYSLKKKKFLFKKYLKELVNCSHFLGPTSVAIGGNFPNLLLFDFEKQKICAEIPTKHNSNAIDFCPARQLFACALDDTEVQLVSPQVNTLTGFLKGHEDYNFCVKFLDDNLLVSGGQDITTRLWDIRKPGKELLVLPGKHRSVSAFEYIPEENLLFVLEAAGCVHSYRFDHGEVLQQTLTYPNWFTGFALTPSRRQLVVGLYQLFLPRSGILVLDINALNPK